MRTGTPIRSAYHRALPREAPETELATIPVSPKSVRCARRRLGRHVRRDSDPADDDECERKQPDEEPVGKGTGHEAAADLDVPVGDHVDRVDGAVPAAHRLGPLLVALRALAQVLDPAHR